MMANPSNSSSDVQTNAEKELFIEVQNKLGVTLTANPPIPLADDSPTCIQPDFYSEEHGIVGEIFAHIGKPKKAQDNKIANDILKMLLLDKIKDRKHTKYLVVCDRAEKDKLEGKSALAESIRQFDIKILCVDIDESLRNKILQAQELQKMTNAD